MLVVEPTNVTTYFHAALNLVHDLTKARDTDRRLLQQLEQRKAALLRRLRKQPAPTILLSNDLLTTIAVPFTGWSVPSGGLP